MELNAAMALHKEAERLCRDLDGAMALHKEEESSCRELGHKDGLSVSLGNQALILIDRGKLDGTVALFKEQERLCREFGNLNGLSISLANQALLLSEAHGRRREARRLADEALAIATRHGYPQLVPRILSIRDSIPMNAER